MLVDLNEADTLSTVLHCAYEACSPSTPPPIEADFKTASIRVWELREQQPPRLLGPEAYGKSLKELEVPTLTALRLERKVDGRWPGESTEIEAGLSCVELSGDAGEVHWRPLEDFLYRAKDIDDSEGLLRAISLAYTPRQDSIHTHTRP